MTTKFQTTNSSFTSKAERQETFLPVSGFVWFFPEEIKVIDHPMFQRLGYINQLGLTYLVYRGATHKRMEHAFGTVHMVQRMIDALEHTCKKGHQVKKRRHYGAPIQSLEERFIRLGALLHDIGHIACGHTIEDELSLLNNHDSDERLNSIFENNEPIWLNQDKKTLREVVDEEFNKYVPEELKNKGITATQITRMIIRKYPKVEYDEQKNVRKILEESSLLRINICRDMVGNTICADLLDYLSRDWYHIGKQKPYDERILQYMEIWSEKDHPGYEIPMPGKGDKFVVSIGERPQIRTDAVSAILELLEWRYQLAESVLFHRTKLSVAAMLDRAFYELVEGRGKSFDDMFFLSFSDVQILSKCRELAETEFKRCQAKNIKKGKQHFEIASKLLTALEKRQLFKCLTTYDYETSVDDNKRNQIRDMYAKSTSDINHAPKFRTTALRLLEKDFKLSPGSLAMYCPTKDMNSKIAKVNIKVETTVKEFNDYEEDNTDNQLAGGHLAAQSRRFLRLWKVHFFIEHAEKKRLEERKLLGILIDAIEKLVLNNHNIQQGEHVRQDEVVKNLARTLIQHEQSPWHGCEFSEKACVGKYAGSPIPKYPFGFNMIRMHIIDDKNDSKA